MPRGFTKIKDMKILQMLFTLCLLLLAGGAIFAQVDPTLPPPITPDAGLDVFLNWYNALYTGGVIVLGYLHNYIPGITLANTKVLRIVLAAIVLAAIFIALGFTDGVSTAISFASAIGLYELIFKRIKPSPPVTT